MKEVVTTIRNQTGLHARPADVFVRTAKKFESEISVYKGEQKANAKAIIKILLLDAGKDQDIRIVADGIDENEAVSTLVDLIDSGFKGCE